MKKLLSLFVSLLLVLTAVPCITAAEVNTSARAYALYCVNNGELLLSQNPDERLPMASTTKIMTMLITLEIAEKEDRVVEFTDEMTAEGSSMYLKPGEKVRLSDLAAGMMMQSGNDAANAAAIAISGSIKRFVERMNQKARQLGLTNTRFVTPSGLDDEGHFSSARDMAVLMAYALENNSFRKLTSQPSVTVRFVDPPDQRVTYQNHNRLLSLYDGCIGGKTGYTMTAGRCLVTAAEREGLTLVAVTLDDRDDWDDHTALYDYGFSRYTAVNKVCCDYHVPVAGGTADEISVKAGECCGIVIPRDALKQIKTTVLLPPFLYAPVTENEIVGRIVYMLDEQKKGEVLILSEESVSYNDRKRGLWEYLADVLVL